MCWSHSSGPAHPQRKGSTVCSDLVKQQASPYVSQYFLCLATEALAYSVLLQFCLYRARPIGIHPWSLFSARVLSCDYLYMLSTNCCRVGSVIIVWSLIRPSLYFFCGASHVSPNLVRHVVTCAVCPPSKLCTVKPFLPDNFGILHAGGPTSQGPCFQAWCYEVGSHSEGVRST